MANNVILDLENPGNPGSANHDHGCKPCNKYNPSRPNNSCKHGKECDFCHCQHERPKHRGQRGRHALQRRQYLESRDECPEEYRNIVDRIYQVPHHWLDEVKRRLQSVPPQQREEKVLAVLEEIREIGGQAQHSRPDSSRLRGARIVTTEGMSPLAELDGRCKWLVGTLHLMVRKMSDAKEAPEKMEETVSEILERCKRLPEALDKPRPPEKHVFSDWVSERTELEERCKWLQPTLCSLALEALNNGTSKEEVEATLFKIRTDCELLPSALASADKQDLSTSFQKARSLARMADLVEGIAAKYKEALLGAESLEDLLPQFGLEEFQAKDESSDSAQYHTCGYSVASGSVPLRSAPSGDTNCRHTLSQAQLMKELDERFQTLHTRCRFVEDPIRVLTTKEFDKEESLQKIAAILDNIFQECRKLPGLMDETPQLRLFSAQDVEDRIRLRLLPSDSLQHLLTKLRELIRET